MVRAAQSEHQKFPDESAKTNPIKSSGGAAVRSILVAAGQRLRVVVVITAKPLTTEAARGPGAQSVFEKLAGHG